MGKGMYVYYLFFICSRGTTDALQKIPFYEKACKIVYRISSYQEDFVYLYFVLILNQLEFKVLESIICVIAFYGCNSVVNYYNVVF